MNNRQMREFEYSPSDFAVIQKNLYDLTGIKLADTKDSMVYSRLSKRVRQLGLSNFKSYLRYLSEHDDEVECFVNALTTNLTAFFREAHHFTLLEHYLRDHPKTRTIWCAACSTGEEAYSIAMTVAETFGRFDTPIKIIASDIDSQVLHKAQEGIYDLSRVESLDTHRLKHFFHKGKGHNTRLVRVVPELKNMIEFKRINLTQPQWPLTAPVDVIFCRNVMIYFDRSTQLKILERMMQLLIREGLYLAGHSENLSFASRLCKPIGYTAYQPIKTELAYE